MRGGPSKRVATGTRSKARGSVGISPCRHDLQAVRDGHLKGDEVERSIAHAARDFVAVSVLHAQISVRGVRRAGVSVLLPWSLPIPHRRQALTTSPHAGDGSSFPWTLLSRPTQGGRQTARTRHGGFLLDPSSRAPGRNRENTLRLRVQSDE